MIEVNFVMEQHIGHRTFAENLKQFMIGESDFRTNWLPVSYEEPGGFWERLFFLPRHLQGTLRGRQQVRNGLRAHGADFTVYNTQVPAVLAGQLRERHPYLLCTDITPIQYDQMAAHYQHTPDRSGWLQQYKHKINRHLFQTAAHCLPWSSWVADSLVADYGVSPNRITVMPPGVDIRAWTPCFHEHDGPLQILFVGGDFYRKGGGYLLEAFGNLPAGSAQLHLVTREPLTGSEQIFVYNDLQPNSAPLIRLYEQADLFVLPTQAEAFGIAAVEAAAMGLPVLATAVGGLVDIIADGETGYLLPPADTQVLTGRLQELARAPEKRVRMGKTARRRVEERFDSRKNSARLAALIRTLAREGDDGR